MLFVFLEILVLRRIKFRIDRSQWSILVGYTISFALRLINVVIRMVSNKTQDDESLESVQSIQLVADCLTCFLVYKFLLDTREVRIKLEATNVEQFVEKGREHKTLEIIIYALFFTLQLPSIAI